jgi:hypothetical protein
MARTVPMISNASTMDVSPENANRQNVNTFTVNTEEQTAEQSHVRNVTPAEDHYVAGVPVKQGRLRNVSKGNVLVPNARRASSP